jgi:hypothetical protein
MTQMSPEELAAVIAALNAVWAPEPVAPPAMAPWRRAMRSESVVPFDE